MRIGIDLGGTKIEAVALGDDGSELDRRRQPTPQGDYDRTCAAIRDLVVGIEAAVGRSGTVGIGFPGSPSPATGLIRNCNATWINGRPFACDLETVLERPVRIANDANCFTVSEATDGAAAGARMVFGIILGTGVGGGLAIDGRVHEGPNANAGEWGHVPLPWPQPQEILGPACFCGRRGCLETWLAGQGLTRAHSEALADGGGRGYPPAASAAPGLAPAEVSAQATACDPTAWRAFARYRSRLARALALMVNTLDPDVIVVGGGLSNVPALYDDLQPEMAPYVFGGECTTPIRKAAHGDASGVRGAAWLWPR